MFNNLIQVAMSVTRKKTKFLLSMLFLIMIVFSYSFTNHSNVPSPPSAPGQPMVIDIWADHCVK